MGLVDYLLMAVGALGSTVIFLFGLGLSAYRDLKKDHKDCESSKMAIFERVIRLEERTGTERRSPPQ